MTQLRLLLASLLIAAASCSTQIKLIEDPPTHPTEDPPTQTSEDPEHAISAPPPGDVVLRAVIYGGSGCPQTSSLTTIVTNRRYFAVYPPTIEARSGANTTYAESRKNCQINFDLLYPEGWQFRVVDSLEVKGHASLDSGVNATVKSTIYFSGKPGQFAFQNNIAGPTEEDYDHAPSAPYSELWSPCGNEALLNVDTQVRLTGSSENATSSITLEEGPTFNITWRTC